MWIEIIPVIVGLILIVQVTPFTGVWIEIIFTSGVAGTATSHSLHGSVDWNNQGKVRFDSKKSSLPSRECGLKYHTHRFYGERRQVTPFTGVWIEILHCGKWSGRGRTSLPSRECGLKLQQGCTYPISLRSLPSRECGLKFCSFTSANTSMAASHSLHGSVDWNSTEEILKIANTAGHSLHGSVDWNIHKNQLPHKK